MSEDKNNFAGLQKSRSPKYVLTSSDKEKTWKTNDLDQHNANRLEAISYERALGKPKRQRKPKPVDLDDEEDDD